MKCIHSPSSYRPKRYHSSRLEGVLDNNYEQDSSDKGSQYMVSMRNKKNYPSFIIK